MLRNRSGCKRVEQTGNWRRLDYIIRSLMICTPHRILFDGDQIGKNKLGEARSTYGGEERRIQGFGGEN
jgi:hypothetical protein